MKITRPGVVFPLVALAVIVVREVWPKLLDLTDLILIAVGLLPLLPSLIRSAEFPGGLKIEFSDVQRAGEKVIEGIVPPADTEAARPTVKERVEEDPNLALVRLRIEIERRLRTLAERHSIREQQSLMRIFRDLQHRGVLSDPVLSGLQELVNFGNRAAHGAQVGPEATTWAIEIGPRVLAVLDKHLDEE